MKKIKSKPVVLYVEQIEKDPEMVFEERESSIDMELDASQCEHLLSVLNESLENRVLGTIRIRFIGRMQH